MTNLVKYHQNQTFLMCYQFTTANNFVSDEYAPFAILYTPITVSLYYSILQINQKYDIYLSHDF